MKPWFAAGLLLAGACTATGDDVQPIRDQLYFPTGLALSPNSNDSILFVVNANADLRYDSGTVIPVDVEKVAQLVAGWRGPQNMFQMPAECAPDGDSVSLICEEALFTIPDPAVRIGNFATDVQVQQLQNGLQRLFVAVRGDPSITWADWDPGARTLSCGSGEGFPRCDENHRLTRLRDNKKLPALLDEPFNLLVNSTAGYVVMSHLTRSAITLADAPVDGSPPLLSNQLDNLFAAQEGTGARGSVGVGSRTPNAANDLIYATSRTDARVITLTVSRSSGFPALVQGDSFFLNKVRPSNDARGITFNPGGTRGYVVNRNPPLLHIVDTSVGTRGVPRNEFINGVEICAQASSVVIADTGRGERVYVGCFRDGQVWTIDPGRPPNQALESVTDVGLGPHGLAISMSRKLLFVSNFREDTISVIDLTPGSPLENRVALKLGRPRPPTEFSL